MNPIHRERLQRLANLLRNMKIDRKHKFSLDTWYETNCTTVGWAAQDPWFIEQGLTLAYGLRRDFRVPAYRNRRGFGAAATFFGISPYDADYLFDSGQYDGEGNTRRTTVAKRIEQFLEDQP